MGRHIEARGKASSLIVPSMYQLCTVHTCHRLRCENERTLRFCTGRYPIPRMLESARLVLGKMHEMAHDDAATREQFFRQTLRSLVMLCTAFPLLTENAVELLLKVQAVDRSHRAVNPTWGDRMSGPGQTSFGACVTAAFEQISAEVLLSKSLII